jgi:hypothetical protein
VLFDVSLFGAAQLTTATGTGALTAAPDSAAALAPTRTLPALAPKLAVGIAFVLAVVFSFWPNPALDAVSHWLWVVHSGPATAAR